ncbi:MAG: hypothetical protein AB7L13_12090 [Acidimicrobiia bacterium]
MPSFDKPDIEQLNKAVYQQRYAALARADVDLSTLSTWDPALPRDKRILVPIDVQAFVVAQSGGEPTVPIRGFAPDPEPFAGGTVRAPGVHLHWAMPDSLLVGKESADHTRLDLPPLPDRWVVVRALLPIGVSRALTTGWVIDAVTGTVESLATFSGTFAPAPADAVRFEPLDGGFGGSLLWTSSYEASSGRFAIHDRLDDLDKLKDVAPRGFHGAHAVYTVCGWWSQAAQDPLAASRGVGDLDRRLADLGWLVVHDADDAAAEADDPKITRWMDTIGFDRPSTDPPVEIMIGDTKQTLVYEGVQPNVALPVEKVSKVVVGRKQPSYSTLVHGAVLGVPVDGSSGKADDRPSPGELSIALGLDVDDVVAAFGADALGLGDDARASAERLVAAFAGSLLDRLSSADGLSELAEREHAEGFWSFVGPPVPGARPDRLRVQDSTAVNATTVGRKGRGAVKAESALSTTLVWNKFGKGMKKGVGGSTSRSLSEAPKPTTTAAAPSGRFVAKPAPRMYRPQPPLLALRGAKPSHRHHDDGLYDESGRLRCRYPAECVTAIKGVVEGTKILPTLGNGAIPAEVLTVVREAVLLDPYGYSWLAAAGQPPSLVGPAETRLKGEIARLFGTNAVYDPSGRAAVAPGAFGIKTGDNGASRARVDPWQSISNQTKTVAGQVAAEFARFSLVDGTPPSPIAVTTWRQPWIPMWLEWKVTLAGSDRMAGWSLDAVDLELPKAVPGATRTFTFVGRSPLNEGVGDALRHGIEEWLVAEQTRDAASPSRSQLSDTDEKALDALVDALAPVDLVSASLDGIREQLLGIGYLGQVERGPVEADGSTRPLASQLPTPLFGGVLTVEALRLVDTFGRTLEVPVKDVETTTTLAVTDAPTSIRLRPRVQHGARWLFRLVDPAYPTSSDPLAAPEAFVDQIEPGRAVNPVVGFLLPDHIDEALEFFDVTGTPLGQLMHDEITGGVLWEPAPGRPLPPDAGPLDGLDAHTELGGRLANGVVQADVDARAGVTPPESSALSAMLRCIDTTLWSVDTFAALGSPTVAGLVGRPIAVVRATIRLELPNDLDEVSIAHAGGADARKAAFDRMNEELFPFRLGDLNRSDDSLLGFFVDDDYRHLHVVDRVVMSSALESGRHRGFLGLLGDRPEADPLDHPYLVAEDTLWLRPGQTVRLTLLMLPAGKVTLTSGVLPRKAIALAEDWVSAGLLKLMPSLRVGPVLLDPSEVRLPLVNLLGDRQTFTRRTGPLTWRDDPILAASQAALLPRLPHEVQEGWIRVTPDESAGQ